MEAIPNSSIGRPPIPSTSATTGNFTGIPHEHSRKLTSNSSSSSLDKYLPSSVRGSPLLLAQARTPRTLMAMSGNTSSTNIPSLDDDTFSLTPPSIPTPNVQPSSSTTQENGLREGGSTRLSSLSGSTSSSSAASPVLSYMDDVPRSPARKTSEVVSYSMGSMKNCDFINDLEMTLPESSTPQRRKRTVASDGHASSSMHGSPGLWNQLHSPSSK